MIDGMTLYEQMTNTLNSFDGAANDLEKRGIDSSIVRGMAEGVRYVRENLTIGAAECVVF
jgi:hypothetical protein